jgi:hypothetical protein
MASCKPTHVALRHEWGTRQEMVAGWKKAGSSPAVGMTLFYEAISSSSFDLSAV